MGMEEGHADLFATILEDEDLLDEWEFRDLSGAIAPCAQKCGNACRREVLE